MSKKHEKPGASSGDTARWLAVAGLLLAGIAVTYYYATQPLSIRMIGWVVLTCALALIAVQTAKGRVALNFMKLSRAELAKVVWPTRQEAVQTTLIVIVMVVVVGFILWALDVGLLWAVGFLTGQRG